MNRQEADKIIELMGGKKCELPYNQGAVRIGIPQIYFYNGFCIYFSGTYYFIIKGNFPAKIAEKISEKAIELKIRIDGGCADWTVLSRLTHDRLKDIPFDINNVDDFKRKRNEIEEDVLNNDYDNCYVETYHIDTVDGLKYVLDIIKENNITTEWFKKSFI